MMTEKLDKGKYIYAWINKSGYCVEVCADSIREAKKILQDEDITEFLYLSRRKN